MKKNIRHYIQVEAKKLDELIGRVSIARGKDSGYFLHLSKRKNKGYKLSVLCNSETMQSISVMVADWKGKEVVDGALVDVNEMEGELLIYAAPLFRDVVSLLSDSEFLFLTYEGNNLRAANANSAVDVPTTGKTSVFEDPKNTKTVKVKVQKEVLVKNLPFIYTAIPSSMQSPYGQRYGLRPYRDDEREMAMINILASNGSAIASGDFELLGMSEDFAEATKNLRYAMLPADKLTQIVSNAKSDEMEMTFFYEADNITPKQVNIKCGNDNYQIMTYVSRIYSSEMKSLMERKSLEFDCTFQVETKGIINAYNIASVNGSKSSDIEVSKNKVLISNTEKTQKTAISGVIQMAEGIESVHITANSEMMIHILKPYSGKIMIKGSDISNQSRLITFEGGESNVRIALCMIKPKEDIADEEETSEVTDGKGSKSKKAGKV